MSKLLSKATNSSGVVQSITPEKAGWNYVGFELIKLVEGESYSQPSHDNELCLVVVSGKMTVVTPTLPETVIGDRMSPFERKKPWAVYVPNDSEFSVTALTSLELAVCKAPSSGNHAARIISPEDIDAESRGKGFNKRHVHNILPEEKPADSLLVVEVFTDEGNTSSYPSHKHDTDDAPNETYLEETYYHRFDPPQGFAFQRVYTDDRSLDEAVTVHDGDVVMVPKGYHPVATVAGYHNYYLNVMAGPIRRWCFTWEEAHQWVNSEAYPRS